MPSRTLLALAGWTAAAVAATLTGLAAVEVIGDGITSSTGGRALTPEQVRQQLDEANASPSPDPGRGGTGSTAPEGSASPTPGTGSGSAQATRTPSSTPSPAPTSTPAAAARKTFSTPGGTAGAQCDGTAVRLLLWTPAQGYGVDSADPGPDDEHVDVKFEGSAGKVELRVRCVNGTPVGTWKQDD
ncbi:septum formation initiator [Streptomyces fructofermentans]|uniref:septum formation initiator n=1 Tax=Streptomyces fructofermentans TaxID=152141 RepID=UPI0016782E92|nr:septum formation initiator [Streptomyces fructofermentans]